MGRELHGAGPGAVGEPAGVPGQVKVGWGQTS